MERPRKDVAERKLSRVLDHLERHPSDSYALRNRDRLANRLFEGVPPTGARVERDRFTS